MGFTVEASVTDRLLAIAKKPVDSHEAVVCLLEAFRAGASVERTAELTIALRGLINPIRTYIATALKADEVDNETGVLNKPKELLTEMISTGKLVDSLMLTIEQANLKHFLKVVDTVLVFKSQHTVCKRRFGDRASQKDAFEKLAKTCVLLKGFEITGPKWSGDTQAIGEQLLIPFATELLAVATPLLRDFGEKEIKGQIDAASTAVHGLADIAGGFPGGGVWTSQLSEDMSKAEIVRLYDNTLYEVSKDDKAENAVEAATQALSRIRKHQFAVRKLAPGQSPRAFRQCPRTPAPGAGAPGLGPSPGARELPDPVREV